MNDQPSTRCGYTWDERVRGASCCYRQAWGPYERCVWHAEVAEGVEKPIAELQAQRETESNRNLNRGANDTHPAELLDGARLDTIEAGNSLSFAACSLQDADFSEADLRGADLSEAILRDADLSRARLWDANLSKANLRDADLSGADLRDADLSEARLWDADLSGADLQGADLSAADLRRADLSAADLRNVDLSGANVIIVDLSGARFFDADLSEANFGGADLSETELWDADLSGASFQGADLSGANLRGADLSGADLQDANLLDIAVNQETRCGRQTLAEQRASTAQEWDEIAQVYHDLTAVFGDHGMVGKARTHHFLERRARGLEAKAAGGRLDWGYLGSLGSRYLTGYGVRIWRLVLIMVALFAVSTMVYWIAGVENSLHYSVVAFTDSAPTNDLPPGNLARAFALVETFFGTLLMVLLGYILGSREQF